MSSHLGESDADEPSENGSNHGDIATTQRLRLILILFYIPKKLHKCFKFRSVHQECYIFCLCAVAMLLLVLTIVYLEQGYVKPSISNMLEIGTLSLCICRNDKTSNILSLVKCYITQILFLSVFWPNHYEPIQNCVIC